MSREDSRARWPELAAVVDTLDRTGIQAMWVEDDETGAVLAGRRPERSYTAVEFDPEAILKVQAELAALREKRTNDMFNGKRKKR